MSILIGLMLLSFFLFPNSPKSFSPRKILRHVLQCEYILLSFFESVEFESTLASRKITTFTLSFKVNERQDEASKLQIYNTRLNCLQ